MSDAALAPTADKSPQPRRVAALIALVAVSLLAWKPLGEWQQRRFAMQLAQRALAAKSAAEAQNVVDRLWPMGLPATAPLARMATVQRPEVAAAAQRGLANQLAAWEIELEAEGNASVFATKLAELSCVIAASADELDAAGQLWAKKLSRQMARDCAVLPAEDAWDILRACDRVASLRSASVARLAATAEAAPTSRPLDFKSGAGQVQSFASPLSSRANATMPLAYSSSAELGPPPSPSSELAVILSNPSAASAPPDETRGPAATGPTANPLRQDPSGQNLAEPPRAVQPLNEAGVTPRGDPAPQPALVDVPSPLDMRRLRQQLRPQTDLQLMKLIESGQRFEAAAAQELLRTRGYTAELLQMTRELRQLPANQRRAALERAGALPAAEARHLLRWFLADADAEVRLQALSLLATTGDPQLEELARQRAVDDADPRVADLATKLLQK